MAILETFGNMEKDNQLQHFMTSLVARKSGHDAQLCRMSWMRTSWSRARARMVSHPPSMSVMCVPGLAPGMTQGLPGLRGGDARPRAAPGEAFGGECAVLVVVAGDDEARDAGGRREPARGPVGLDRARRSYRGGVGGGRAARPDCDCGLCGGAQPARVGGLVVARAPRLRATAAGRQRSREAGPNRIAMMRSVNLGGGGVQLPVGDRRWLPIDDVGLGVLAPSEGRKEAEGVFLNAAAQEPWHVGLR